jgi:hypothetical protein
VFVNTSGSGGNGGFGGGGGAGGGGPGGTASGAGGFGARDGISIPEGADSAIGVGGQGGAFGGAIFNYSGTVVLTNCTVSENTAIGNSVMSDFLILNSNGGGYGGGIFDYAGGVSLRNSIVANNRLPISPGLDAAPSHGPDVFGVTASQDHNLIGIDPQLGPLGDNGGPTPTMLPQSGSPVLAAGDPAAAPPTDQRGYIRTRGGAIDIGAVETQPLNDAVTVTTTTVAVAPMAPVAGQPLTLTASVAGLLPGLPAITDGVVAFSVDGKFVGDSVVSGGQVSLPLPSGLAAGGHTIVAHYVSLHSLTTNGSASLPLTVAPDASSTTLVSSGATVFGQPATFTATVSAAAPGSGTPSGTVLFYDNGTLVGTALVGASGQAVFTVPNLTTGSHLISAAYQGDANFSGSTAPAVPQTVGAATTTTTLGSEINPAPAGQPLVLAVVSPAFPGTQPTGTVTFLEGGTPLGSAPLLNGTASFNLPAPVGGTYPLTAAYGGDSNFTGSTSPLFSLTVINGAPTLTGLSATTAVEGGGAISLTLIGTDFVSGAAALWNGSPLPTTFVGPTQLQATVPASALAEEGAFLLTVANPGPSAGPSNAQAFTVVDAGLSATGNNLHVIGTKNFSGVLATFTDADPGATAGDYSATILWDDGSTSAGTISGSGTFTVSASHTFPRFSFTHALTVIIRDQGGSSVVVVDNATDPPAHSHARRHGRRPRHHHHRVVPHPWPAEPGMPGH